ncbi:NADP-dependent 3-hydroxy acid dehydrogenase YdfG [Leifsonia sp. AK011]|uniref:SDR family oxidoreductase n=1 Tax=Leifsonia sp. AK011 TaxID=2723075 RepID=UPI0015C80E3B|nr:SDR family oxidoreductase [Leifsonia sp. AK011]NYF09490.1 NADP-dependent 3-hydroxy acid dehydrogenase YdfG [Leifsonia sp. AK011]
MTLEGRVAVVLGATGWIGRAVCRELLGSGASVAMIARDAERLAELRRELAAGDRVLSIVADVTSPLDLDDARAAALHHFGHIDLVVVLAGVITGSAFEDGVPADWAEMIDVNLRGVLHATQILADPLLEGASTGRTADLVLFGPVSQEDHAPQFAVFNAVSSAVSQLARTLRGEYGARGVRVHLIAPGFRRPDAAEKSPAADPRFGRSESAVTPEAMAAVVRVAAELPRGTNLAEVVLLPTGGGS